VHRLLTLGRGLRSTAKTLKAEMRTPELAEASASRTIVVYAESATYRKQKRTNRKK
jgi:hypothetical protein